jgi:hypothetical protein
MTVAIENFIQLQGLNKILILGYVWIRIRKKRASANCRSLLNVKSVQCFFIGTAFYSSMVSSPQFQLCWFLLVDLVLHHKHEWYSSLKVKSLREWHWEMLDYL